MALRESRHSFRRVGVYMVSITLGVGALVAIHSFRDDVSRSVQEEADVLMGANARLASGRVYPDSVARLLDSLRAEGVETSRVTTASSMVLAPSSNTVRLLQVRAVEGGYPFYGTVTTRPEGRWTGALSPDEILVDPAVLTQLDVVVGDTLVVGRARLAISATVEDLPTSLGFQTAIGPRVYISQEALTRAELLGFGSLAEYETYLRMPDREARETFRTRYEEVLEATKVRFFLAEEQAQSLSNGIRFLGRFLALVGLAALLLGGIGVASAIHVFARDKRTEVAVLRCIGVGQWTAFIAYLIQASALGLLGAFGGVVVGVAVQQVLPFVLGDVLPVDVTTRFSFTSAAAGLGIGVWVAFIFAIIPLLQIRNVPPLQAIRQDFEPERNRLDLFTLAAYGFLAASVVALCVLEAPEPALGLGFAGALTVVFRPQNQTIAVTLALGFGAFVIGTVVEVEGNLRKDLTLSFGGGQPNLLFFDIQKDQIEGVVNLLPEDARAGADVAPLVSARIVDINGQTNDELRADSVREDRPDAWALRRQYRNTYREELGRAEELISGRWWDGTPGSEDGTRVDAGDLTRVSLESDVAEGLKVGLGDTIQWEVSGVPISTVVTSIRTVDWGRMEPNFYAIFEPGGLEDAPQTAIMVARLPDPEVRASVQRDLVTAFPNVSALDFSRVQEAIDSVLSKVRQAVAFLGFFSAIAGMVVLVGALASSRAQRLREGALLKTLGASKRQVLTVLFSEYLALGTLATASGLLLAAVSAAIVMPLVFEIDYSPRFVALSGIWLAVTGLTVVVGLLGSRNLLGRPPLAVLRDAPE
jgi:putative ABC transport system permease protein